jgi:exonuclease III
VKILTFNTGLLELSVGKLSFDVVPYVEERAQLLPVYLKEADADVVCLQEIFRLEDMEILRTISDTYPHMYVSDHKNILKRNGLCIMSKHPFEVTHELKYKTKGVEKFVKKGAVKIRITEGMYTGVEVVNTHFPYGGFGSSSQTLRSTVRLRNKNIQQLHKKIHKENTTTIVAGDFNFGPNIAPENYRKVLSLGYEKVSNGDITWDVENPLNLMFPTSVSKSIDHIFVNEKRDLDFSVLESARVFDTPIKIDGKPAFLSDHFGLLCDIEL